VTLRQYFLRWEKEAVKVIWANMAKPKERQRSLVKSTRLKNRSDFPKRFLRPSNPQQAREWLHDVAAHISNLPNTGPRFRFVAYAIKKTLRSGKLENLSKELGLIYPAGRPRTFQERKTEKDMARKIDALRSNGKTWAQMESILDADKRTMERIYQRHKDRFRKEKMLAPLSRAVREVLRKR